MATSIPLCSWSLWDLPLLEPHPLLRWPLWLEAGSPSAWLLCVTSPSG